MQLTWLSFFTVNSLDQSMYYTVCKLSLPQIDTHANNISEIIQM